MEAENDFWKLVEGNMNKIIAGDPLEAVRLAHEAFHEIARTGDIVHAQAVAEAWMRILAQFMPQENMEV